MNKGVSVSSLAIGDLPLGMYLLQIIPTVSGQKLSVKIVKGRDQIVVMDI